MPLCFVSKPFSVVVEYNRFTNSAVSLESTQESAMEQKRIPIIDTHCHVYPDSIAAHAAEAIGKFYDFPIAADGRVETMLRLGAQAGVCHHVVCSVATTPHQVASVNRFIHATATAQPSRITGLGALHPDSSDQQADVEHILSLGLKGVKLHPDFQQVALDDPRYLTMFELCQGRLPILCHLGDYRYDLSNPVRVRRVLKSFPKLRFIGAHFGGWTLWKEAAEVLHDCDNLLVDSSSSLFALTPEEGAALVRIYGAERVLFGVDYPMWNPSDELERFMRMPIGDEEREKILFKNAAALYGIEISALEGQREER